MNQDAEHALNYPWILVDPPERIGGYMPEDISIYTTDGREVVGSSEWMRCEREVFDHVVALHNEWLCNRREAKR